LEILVVDNVPQDLRTRNLLGDEFPECRYVAELSRGIPFARNRGISKAKGEILAYVDDDCRPVAGWSKAIVHNFAEGPELGCCTGPVLAMELNTRPQRLMEERDGLYKGNVKKLFRGDSPIGGTYPVQPWRFGTGANMAFRRSALDRIGGFDTVLRSAEDLDIFFRIVRAGFGLVYDPEATVWHSPRCQPPNISSLSRV
jgi:cellulose synthase/poly-beta-1,6-N-acetylglucosamine synthase-like glycosyltransferase